MQAGPSRVPEPLCFIRESLNSKETVYKNEHNSSILLGFGLYSGLQT
jgi:hypothetical protein